MKLGLRILASVTAAAALMGAPGDAGAQPRPGTSGRPGRPERASRPERPARPDRAGASLSRAEAGRVIRQAQEAAARTASAEGLRSNSDPERGPVGKRPVKMVVAVVARDGRLIALDKAPDAWVGSEDIAIAKARTAAFFSSDQNALTSRIIGELSQAASGEGGKAGPLWGIWASNQTGITGGRDQRNGLITFPGGVPLYKDGKLVGGIGVSGDAVDQDEAVAFAGAAGFEPGPDVVRLGMKAPEVPTVDEARETTSSAAGRE